VQAFFNMCAGVVRDNNGTSMAHIVADYILRTHGPAWESFGGYLGTRCVDTERPLRI
jgi:hypothetical protein